MEQGNIHMGISERTKRLEEVIRGYLAIGDILHFSKEEVASLTGEAIEEISNTTEFKVIGVLADGVIVTRSKDRVKGFFTLTDIAHHVLVTKKDGTTFRRESFMGELEEYYPYLFQLSPSRIQTFIRPGDRFSYQDEYDEREGVVIHASDAGLVTDVSQFTLSEMLTSCTFSRDGVPLDVSPLQRDYAKMYQTERDSEGHLYEVHFQIRGSMTVVAASMEEARAKFFDADETPTEDIFGSLQQAIEESGNDVIEVTDIV